MAIIKLSFDCCHYYNTPPNHRDIPLYLRHTLLPTAALPSIHPPPQQQLGSLPPVPTGPGEVPWWRAEKTSGQNSHLARKYQQSRSASPNNGGGTHRP